jgi:predicted SnoaL-like aldol condensation-catalyzing enzyme
MCAMHIFQLDLMCAAHILFQHQKAESIMANTSLSPEHADFFERFKSFWAVPSGPRVAEIIAPDAKIHFTGNPTISGADYIEYMDGMLATFPGMTVTPLDCAGNGDMLYIAWETSSVIHGKQRKFLGVDRFRIVDGMAVEEHIVFDSAVLTPEGRPGIDA